MVKTGPREAFLRWGDLRVLEGRKGLARGEGELQILGRRDARRARTDPSGGSRRKRVSEEVGRVSSAPARGSGHSAVPLACRGKKKVAGRWWGEEQGGRGLCRDAQEDCGDLWFWLQLVGSAMGVRREERSGGTWEGTQEPGTRKGGTGTRGGQPWPLRLCNVLALLACLPPAGRTQGDSQLRGGRPGFQVLETLVSHHLVAWSMFPFTCGPESAWTQRWVRPVLREISQATELGGGVVLPGQLSNFTPTIRQRGFLRARRPQQEMTGDRWPAVRSSPEWGMQREREGKWGS